MIKRIMLVAVLTLALTMMMAGVALASQLDAGFYTAWSGGSSPHQGFTTTSVKCGYCHAVHNAERFDGANPSEVLLRGTVANACTACHINSGITTKLIYNGVSTNYTADNSFNHSSAGGARCVDCHTVHGANAIEANLDANAADTKDFILLARGGQAIGTDALGNYTDGTNADYVLSRYCSSCHPYYTANYDENATEQHHVMKAAGSNYGNSQTAYGVGDNRTIADAGSEHCFTCHDYDNVANGFPHWANDGAVVGSQVATGERFMTVGAYAEAAWAPAGVGSAKSDGACIKCHVWTTGTPGDSGAGIDY